MEFQFFRLIDLTVKETNESALAFDINMHDTRATPHDAWYSYSIDDYDILAIGCDFARVLNLPLHTKIMTQFRFTYIDSFRRRNQENILFLKWNKKPWSKKFIKNSTEKFMFVFVRASSRWRCQSVPVRSVIP